MVPARTEVVEPPRALDDVAPAGAVGLLALATDANVESDLRALLPPEVGLYTTRVANTDPITVDTLRAMASLITDAARTIRVGPVDVLVYGCTSGAIVLGEEQVAERLRAAQPGAACLTPAGAAVSALRSLGARRLSILTPYVARVNDLVAEHFADSGFEVVNVAGFGLRRDLDMTRLPPAALAAAAAEVCDTTADALLVSCTSLRATAVIPEIEAAIGRPVVSSNQALVWRLRNLLGFELSNPRLGRLLHRVESRPGPDTTRV
ncbi:hypothetical protein [Umezawaea sp.]|uniref:maleate cis-trans isomerase family protein n=1 Tax=Umezawaea sp. TaxID=1955258 RepID=UPI002ED68B26